MPGTFVTDSPITDLLRRARLGDADASEQIYKRVYGQLHRMARQHLQRVGPLSPVENTELINESFLQLHGTTLPSFNDRHHFLAYASRTMRNVLVDLIRERLAERRGGKLEHIELNTSHADLPDERQEQETLAVDQALLSLAQTDPRLAQIVELRYFAGLDNADIAAMLGVTERTVQRDWAKARVLLHALIRD